MKIHMPTQKPRNPLVAAARFRRSGRHEITGSASRQREHRALRRELEHMKHSP